MVLPSDPCVWGTGRRKTAVARVRIKSGTGNFLVNGKPVGEPFDTFGKLELGPIRELGTFDLISEPLRIRCELTGKSEQSPGHYFGVDCFILEPVE